MESAKLTKQAYIRLGTFSTALAVGTVCSVLGGISVVSVPVAVVGSILASVAGGIVTNDISDILTEQGKDKNILTNNDLTKTVGKAIATVIVLAVNSQDFPEATKTSLRKMAKLADEKWENIVKDLPGEYAPIQESQLTEFFANRPEYFTNLTALDMSLWERLLNYLQSEAEVTLTQPVITDIATRLYEIFPKALREVLKEDFQSDGKAFAGMVLDLFGVMRSQIDAHHNLILQRLDEIKQQNPSAIPKDFNLDEFEKRLELLSQNNQEEIAAELKSVARQIDSGFQEVLQKMGLMQTGITELLENNNTILDRLKNLSEQSQRQYKELVSHIANITDLKTLQTNFWQFLQQKQSKDSPNWLKFLTKEDEDAALVVGNDKSSYFEPPIPSEIPPTISAHKLLWMVINLEYLNYQLLLFNRSKQGVIVYCPSFGYAINPIIKTPQFLLPQKDSWAEKTGQKFLFKQTGKEEFLAIVFEKHLELPWLSPKREEPLPELNAERIKELSEQLQQQDNWHVFYKNFQVVEQ
ncbi:MAG: hypothetical protein JGK17_10185 [Microcoleus sp. PH2017_10_PVI_O_A]|uniref:hypothetical protein n=1 Tax=unclassified Microcoleus TaxID=2642155 RepID=UPI001E116BE4|nr:MULTISPECIES: hypothetical protein [unclassified Microcoleus]TAE83743.1 MAG: hypothetical protein EAZ83_08480 [Oscillatoriales cyanobacterium]MCC3405940.1 hypothetical protein [Microcoleus sp. PH2017_10_PVI_O_A]MCC3459969.1 hypothetical protein [Microcoleus sp. PH2017_11_PCY_U_A]MCC3478483.1 hypothetical protein [Microcoleus sp. PH2017_12_PCY_D_A]MCC3527943.1 hypothetical protein [Microcoleus sp. PH2017_21_RUC_O_A]